MEINKIEYLDYEGLKKYDKNIKKQISNQIKTFLENSSTPTLEKELDLQYDYSSESSNITKLNVNKLYFSDNTSYYTIADNFTPNYNFNQLEYRGLTFTPITRDLHISGTCNKASQNMDLTDSIPIPSDLLGQKFTFYLFSSNTTSSINVRLQLFDASGARVSQSLLNANQYISSADLYISPTAVTYKLVLFLPALDETVDLHIVPVVLKKDSEIIPIETSDTITSLTFDTPISQLSLFPNPAAAVIPIGLKEYIDDKFESVDVDLSDIDLTALETKLNYITPEYFKGSDITETEDSTNYIQQAIDYGIENKVPVRCFKSYKITKSLNIVSDYVDLYIKEINNRAADYAIKITGSYNNIKLDKVYAENNGKGILLIAPEEGTACWGNNIITNRVRCTNECIALTRYSGSSGVNSYNTIKFSRLDSISGDGILMEGNENYIYGGYIRCGQWAIKNFGNSNKYYNIALEAEAKNGIYCTDGSTFTNFRTIECLDAVGKDRYDNPDADVNTKRWFMKLVGTNINKLYFTTVDDIMTEYIDTSEMAYSTDTSGAGDTKLITETVQNIIESISGRLGKISWYHDRSTYNSLNTTGRRMIIAGNGRKIIIPDHRTKGEITTTTYDIKDFHNVEMSDFKIKENCEIRLSGSYCSDGINKITIDQSEGKYANIYDYDNNLVFNGEEEGVGIYEINIIKNPNYIRNAFVNRIALDDVWDITEIDINESKVDAMLEEVYTNE